jgi:diguanylate cyclase
VEYQQGMIEQATSCAARAMSRIAAEGLPPTPQYFSLWYNYFSGHMPDLTRAVDELAAAHRPFTPERMEQLYNKFFSVDREEQMVRDAGDRIQSALGQLLDLLRSSGADSDRYGKALQQFGSRLAVPGLEQLRALVDAIATETKLVAQRNQKLQDQLQSSSAQMEEMRRKLDSVRQEAVTDSLTGLPNRRKFDQTLHETTERAAQTGAPLCLLMIDIDHFKEFNDTYGHTVGDHVLALVARTMKECIRSTDLAARYGGEEFAVILPSSSLADAVRIAESIRTSVASKRIVNRSKNQTLGTITLSIGAAPFADGDSLADLIKLADRRLYAAKRQGRNRVVAEDDDMAMA